MIRILIVEDEKPISELMRLSLTKAGYSCHCAYDGAQAADILEKEIFDLVLLDVMLPPWPCRSWHPYSPAIPQDTSKWS